MRPILEVQEVSQTYTDSPQPILALNQVQFSVAPNDIVCLVGPSGSGKTSLLRIIGGLSTSYEGRVLLSGKAITSPHPEIGFIFQQTNLMPWRTVIQNVLLPAEIAHGDISQQYYSQAVDLLGLMGLDGFADVYPRQLSGGMAQRVVLARALMQRPQLLLMDEPFSALDSLTRERLNLELLRIHRLQNYAILMVTHSISEAVFLADRVLIMSERPGSIVADVPVPLSRPRSIDQIDTAEFGHIASQIRQYLNFAQR